MASNETAALVVALSAQVSQFQKDMDKANAIASKSVKQIEDRFAAAGNVIRDRLGGFANNAASQLGTAGDVLRALGPIGLGVATAIGSLALGFASVSEKVDIFVEKVKRLKEASEVTGLTTSQLAALSEAAKRAGLDFEKAETFALRLSVAFEQLRTKGTGEFADQLLAINKNLLLEVANARNLADAIDILSRAYTNMTQQQRILLTRSITGQRNLDLGQILVQLSQGGGFKQMEDGARAAGKTINDELGDAVRKLDRDVQSIKRHTDKLYGETFSLDVLEAQKQSAEAWHSIAEAVVRVYTFLRGRQLSAQPPTPEKPTTFADRFAPALGLPPTINRPPPDEKQDAAARLELLNKTISAMGDAATQALLLERRQDQLGLALKRNEITQAQYNRALEFFKVAQESAIIAVREQLGVATEEEILKAKLIEIDTKYTTEYRLNAEERAKADRVARRESRDRAQAVEVRASATPELTRSLQEANNLLKQFDTLSVSALNNASDAFADVVTGAKKLNDALRDLSQTLARDLSRAAFRSVLATLFGPTATAGGGFIEGLLRPAGRQGGGSVFAGNAYMVGERGPELFTPGSSGMITPNDVLRRGAGGGTVINNHYSVNVDGATGNTEIRAMVAAGMRQAYNASLRDAPAAISRTRKLAA